MKTTSFVTFTLAALSATVLSAPTPQMLTGLLGSITEPSAGNGNLFQGNGINNGNQNGNDNSAGNNNGNNNEAGNGNVAGSGNSVSLPSLKDILKERDAQADLLDPVKGIVASLTAGSITSPSAGDANQFLENLNGNGNGNGNGNSAGNDNGNGNSAGNGNEAGSGNTVTVSPTLPELPALPALPNVNIDPTINLARTKLARL